MRKLITILVCTLAATIAAAQGFYYQSTMPDGRVIIGDKPAPGAKESKQIPLRQGNLSAPLVTPPPPGSNNNNNSGAATEGRSRRETSAQQKAAQGGKSDSMADAQDALKKAQAALDAAQEPLPGERVGTAGGKSRLTDAYTQRIQGLQDAVADAQKRVDDVRRGELH